MKKATRIRVVMSLVLTLMVLWPNSPPSGAMSVPPVQTCDANCCYCCFQTYDWGGNCLDYSFNALCGPFFACHQVWTCWGSVCFWPMGLSLDMICAVASIGC